MGVSGFVLLSYFQLHLDILWDLWYPVDFAFDNFSDDFSDSELLTILTISQTIFRITLKIVLTILNYFLVLWGLIGNFVTFFQICFNSASFRIKVAMILFLWQILS